MAKKPAAKKAVKPAPKKAAKAAPKKVAKPAAKKAAKAAPAPKKKAVASKPVKKVAAKAPAKKVAAKAPAKKVAAKAKKVVQPVVKKKAVPTKTKKAVETKKVTKPVAKKEVAKKATPVAKQKPAAPKEAAKAAPKQATPKTTRKRAPKEKEVKVKVPAKPLVTQRVAPNRPMPAPVVKKQVSTLEHPSKLRYEDDELVEFRTLINKKLDEARKDYDLLKQTLANNDNNGTDDTSPSFKMIEDGSETLSREETSQLAGRQEKFIKHLEDALLRIRNKTYGLCRVTGRLISKERLRLVPHATLSIEAKQQMSN